MLGLSINSRRDYLFSDYENARKEAAKKFENLFRTMPLTKVQAYAKGGFNSSHRAAAESIIAAGDVDADRMAVLQMGLDNEESKRFCGVC